jgi:diguanylate cyclase (GGDEF)-like protein/PAS domain S-box-containing protein
MVNARNSNDLIEPAPKAVRPFRPEAHGDSSLKQMSLVTATDLDALIWMWPLMFLAEAATLILFASEYPGVYAGLSATSFAPLALTFTIDLVIMSLRRIRKFGEFDARSRHGTVMALMLISTISFSLFVTFAVDRANEPAAHGFALMIQACIVMIATTVGGKQRFVGLIYAIGVLIILYNAVDLLVATLISVTFFAVTVFAILGHIKRDQADTFRRQEDLREEQRARQLLHDYEAAGLGWFWETDRLGRVTYVSDSVKITMAEALGELIGRPLTELIAPHTGNNSHGDRTLGFHLSSRSPFVDIAVQAASVGEERWWSLSGAPIINEYGQFHGFRGSGSDLTEMRKSQEEVKQLAQYDSLTGLSNRLQMLQILEKAIVGLTGEVRPCALFLLDLDRFKSVNDTLGHPVGDILLKQVSQRLERVIGEEGRVGRLGGDEFKVVFPSLVNRNRLAQLADAVISTLSQPYTIEGNQVVIGASVGIAIAPDDGGTTQSLIRNADLALYAAKGAGRGVHRFYDKSMHADAEDRRVLEEDLRKALARGHLRLAYQPQVSMTTNKIAGFEALLRWEHPVRGNISPSIFIPIAEDAGLIAQIGEWALRTACMEVAKWPNNIKVAVNVSPVQFANPSLPAIVANALASSQLDPARLELEITESVFLNDDDSTNQMFTALKNIGVRLSLDDFGTGYSSLGYLKTAPFDKIKIDQSFVRGATIEGNRNAAIIRSIVSLAEALDMDTIAEGAETQDELALIKDLGCSHVQGYIYGKPMTPEEALVIIEANGGMVEAKGYRVSRKPRKAMLRFVSLIHGAYRYNAKIKNITENGAMIEGLWNVPENTKFIVEFAPGYRVICNVRWSIDNRMGVAFAEAVDLTRLKSLANSSLDPGKLRAA